MERQRKSIRQLLICAAPVVILMIFFISGEAWAVRSDMLLIEPVACVDTEKAGRSEDYTIQLKSRQFTPQADIQTGLETLTDLPANESKHMLIQFERIPTLEMRETLKASGVELLSYVPHKAWYASVTKEVTMQDLFMASVRWIGELQPIDKISPALQERGPGPWAVNPDGTVNLHVLFFEDVKQEKAFVLLEAVGTVKAGP